MKIVPLIYTHRHGLDVCLYRVPNSATVETLPVLTNEIMLRLGYSNPELERDDEKAEWGTIVAARNIMPLRCSILNADALDRAEASTGLDSDAGGEYTLGESL